MWFTCLRKKAPRPAPDRGSAEAARASHLAEPLREVVELTTSQNGTVTGFARPCRALREVRILTFRVTASSPAVVRAECAPSLFMKSGSHDSVMAHVGHTAELKNQKRKLLEAGSHQGPLEKFPGVLHSFHSVPGARRFHMRADVGAPSGPIRHTSDSDTEGNN